MENEVFYFVEIFNDFNENLLKSEGKPSKSVYIAVSGAPDWNLKFSLTKICGFFFANMLDSHIKLLVF